MSKTIQQALELAADWANWDGVEMVAQGEKEGRDTIVVHVSRDDAVARLPATLVGYPVEVVFSGTIHAQRSKKGENGS